MHFSRLSVVAGVAVFWASFQGAAAMSQQVAECEQKCSQKWSFPAPAPSSISSSETKAKVHTSSTVAVHTSPTMVVHTSSTVVAHTTTYAPPPPPVHTPEPASSSAVAHNAQVKPSSSATARVAAVTKAPEPSTTPPAPSPTPSPAPSSSSSDISGYLDPHNAARAAHGASPLAWSDELAAAAQKWANGCVFQHSGGSLGAFGENLAAGSGDYSAASGVKAWVDEAPEYSSSNPVPSHFTQVVWKATTKVGCAVASCNLANFDKQFWPVKYHVCEYSSAGNVIGQFATNVQA